MNKPHPTPINVNTDIYITRNTASVYTVKRGHIYIVSPVHPFVHFVIHEPQSVQPPRYGQRTTLP